MPKFGDTTYLVGCDPELFVFDTADNKFVGAHGIVPGTKEVPHLLDGGMVQVDGLALEFGIDPAFDENEWIDKIKHVMNQIHGMVGNRYQLIAQPVVRFSEDVMAAQLPENLELGCEPDYNAYTLETNPRPTPPESNMRSGGGHAHIGYGSGMMQHPDLHLEACALAVQQFDAIVGVGTLKWDTDSERRRIYGQPGAFRPKNYGFEYRTPSNAWMASEERQRWMFRLITLALQKLHEGEFAPDTLPRVSERIIRGEAYTAQLFWDKIRQKEVKGGYFEF
jgi:hypothetical protein